MSNPHATVLLCSALLCLSLPGCREVESAASEIQVDLVARHPIARIRQKAAFSDSPDLPLLGVAPPRPSSSHPVPGPRAEGDALIIPHGFSVDHFLRMAPASRLRIAKLRGASGTLVVSLTREGEAERTVAELGPTDRQLEVHFSNERAEIVRLSLTARAAGASEAEEGALVVRQPHLSAPLPAASGPEKEGAKDWPLGGALSGRPNIVFYLIDALRSDHLGCYGAERDLSPAIDAFARRATVFERMVAQSSWTRPSVASLFTGVWPYTHAVNRRSDALAGEWRTLAEELRQAGYRTAAFVANPNLDPVFGLGRGFDRYVLLKPDEDGGDAQVDAEEVNRQALAWLDQQEGGAPFFLYVHTIDPHDPYDAPAAFKERFASSVPPEVAENPADLLRALRRGSADARGLRDLRSLYAAEVAYSDASFGDFRAALEQRGLLDEALVLLLSDHGEEFHEHGNWAHGRNLHRESTRIPLVVKFPQQQQGRRVSAAVQHIDLMPALLGWLNLPASGELESSGLVSTSGRNENEIHGRPVYSFLELTQRSVSIEAGPWKLVQSREEARRKTRLYHIGTDRNEVDDLSGERPILTAFLEGQLKQRMLESRPVEGQPASLAPELQEQLRALGYF